MLVRSVGNLHQIYQQRQDGQTSLRMKGYLLALTKHGRRKKKTG